MLLQHRVPLLSAGSGGGGGDGMSPDAIVPYSGVNLGLYGYQSLVAGEVGDGDLLIYGYNYRGSGIGTPGTNQPSNVTNGARTSFTDNSRYDTGGVSDGGFSLGWSLTTSDDGGGSVTLQSQSERAHLVIGFPAALGYNTVVQSQVRAVNATTAVTFTLPSEPSGPVILVCFGGGALDTTDISVDNGFTELVPFISPSTGTYERWSHVFAGTAQSVTSTATANQVSAGGSGGVILELGTV